MAIGSSLPTQSLSPLNTTQQSQDILIGLRESISLGSGLRTGVVLVDSAGRVAAELEEARAAAAEAAREAARTETELADAERANARVDEQTGDQPQANGARLQAGAENADRSINAAQAAGESGETAERGSFVDLAV
jgi:hypothetical protein